MSNNEHLIKDKTSTFIVRVSADPMEPCSITDGDELIVNRILEPKVGFVVIAGTSDIHGSTLTSTRLWMSRVLQLRRGDSS